jgi:hypothetical protein
MEVGHLLTWSDPTHPQVSSMFSPGFFCLLACRFILSSVIRYGYMMQTFSSVFLYFVQNASCVVCLCVCVCVYTHTVCVCIYIYIYINTHTHTHTHTHYVHMTPVLDLYIYIYIYIRTQHIIDYAERVCKDNWETRIIQNMGRVLYWDTNKICNVFITVVIQNTWVAYGYCLSKRSVILFVLMIFFIFGA